MNIKELITDIYFKIYETIDRGNYTATEIMNHKGYPIIAIKNKDNPRIFISSGMHCDEYSQIFAHLNFLKENGCGVPFLSIPLINPYGLSQYPKRDKSNRRWGKNEGVLQKGIEGYINKFDKFIVSIDMHEDTEENGLYIYGRGKYCSDLIKKILKESIPPCLISKKDLLYGDKCLRGVISSEGIKENTLESYMSNYSEISLTSEVPGKFPQKMKEQIGQKILDSLFRYESKISEMWVLEQIRKKIVSAFK